MIDTIDKKNCRSFRILITDDDSNMREVLRELVENEGFASLVASSGDEAFEIVQAKEVHLALLDMHMPKMTGLETLNLLRTLHALLPAILLTADATKDVMKRAFEAHVFSVIPKPMNKKVVTSTIFRALVQTYGSLDSQNLEISTQDLKEKDVHESSTSQRQNISRTA